MERRCNFVLLFRAQGNGGEGGALSFDGCLSHLTMDHAPLSRRGEEGGHCFVVLFSFLFLFVREENEAVVEFSAVMT